jgi:hypothetical protein
LWAQKEDFVTLDLPDVAAVGGSIWMPLPITVTSLTSFSLASLYVIVTE